MATLWEIVQHGQGDGPGQARCDEMGKIVADLVAVGLISYLLQGVFVRRKFHPGWAGP